MASVEYPIIKIAQLSNDLQPRNLGGFGEPKEIVVVTQQLRGELSSLITSASQRLAPTLHRWNEIPAVLSLMLRPEALAKSHRPMQLLERVGMLPIGAKKLGELLLPVTSASLSHLDRVIRDGNAKKIRANISTISGLHAHTSDDVLGQNVSDQSFRNDLQQWINANKPFQIELFDYRDNDIARKSRQLFKSFLEEHEVEILYPELNDDVNPVMFFRAQSVDDIIDLANFPGMRCLTKAAEFSTILVNPQSFEAIGQATVAHLPPPPADANLPVVGVIDSGVTQNDPLLSPWIESTNVYILPPETDHLHGTFVSGIIAGSRSLNSGNPQFPDCAALIHSVAAIGSGSTSIGELILRIKEAVAARPDIKVWNCSFGSSTPGDPHSFGYFASQLDALADQHQILFIIAAGNYQTVPLRSWPTAIGFSNGMDRISEPAEATRALTVGSVAHLPNLVSAGDPSPFSRRGPGPGKIPKPEVVHFGGNTTDQGDFAGSGVRSIIPGSLLCESVGTSFSTPIVSVIAANTWHGLTNNTQRPEVVKALVVHAAEINSGQRTQDDRLYFGFGIPESPIDTLFCTPDSFTLMFEAELFDGTVWAKTPFPIPACLRPSQGQFRGEIIMTVVYSPPVDSAQGEEYVRANVNASLGSFDPDNSGDLHHHGLVPLEKPSHSDLYEEALIDHGYKWSPVKVYRKRFPRGVQVDTMRLKLELLRRAGEAIPVAPQYAVVVVTMRGLEPDLPVYNDGIAALHQSNWIAESISQQTQIHI